MTFESAKSSIVDERNKNVEIKCVEERMSVLSCFVSQARVEEISEQTRQLEWIALVQKCLLSRQYRRILASSTSLGKHNHSVCNEDSLCPRREYTFR